MPTHLAEDQSKDQDANRDEYYNFPVTEGDVAVDDVELPEVKPGGVHDLRVGDCPTPEPSPD